MPVLGLLGARTVESPPMGLPSAPITRYPVSPGTTQPSLVLASAFTKAGSFQRASWSSRVAISRLVWSICCCSCAISFAWAK